MNKNIFFFALQENFDLARKIAGHFSKTLIIPCVDVFADYEVRITLPNYEGLLGCHAIIIHSTHMPVSENIFRVLFLMHELKTCGIKKLTVIVPYFGYARQCVNEATGKPGVANLIAKLFETAGVDHIITVEIHDGTLSSFFSVSFDSVNLSQCVANHIKKTFEFLDNFCIVAPDKGATDRVELISQILNLPSVLCKKKRYDVDKVEIIGVSGDCKGKTAIIIDDIFGTGNTAMLAAKHLIAQGVIEVYGYFIHPVFSRGSENAMKHGFLKEMFVSNSIILPEGLENYKIKVFDVSEWIIDKLETSI